MRVSYLFSLTFVVAINLVSCLKSGTYREDLSLSPVSPIDVLASFEFSSVIPLENLFKKQEGGNLSELLESDTHHYALIPRSLGQILQRTGTQELHLRLTQGRWSDSWGNLPKNGIHAGGTGFEIWAYLSSDDKDLFQRWSSLANSLSGLFCASLNFVDSTRIIKPQMSLQSSIFQKSESKLKLLYGSLPREPVCTENLTPFLKLLPCKGYEGIASLLDGHRLFDAKWQSLSVDIEPFEKDGKYFLQIGQRIDVVIDADRSVRRGGSPIPQPEPLDSEHCNFTKTWIPEGACFPLDEKKCSPWWLSELFGRQLKGRCPISTPSDQSDVHVCSPVNPELCNHYKLQPGQNFNVHYDCRYSVDMETMYPPVIVQRSLTGHGQVQGGFKTIFESKTDQDVQILYLESLIWPIKPFINTLSVSVVGPNSAQSYDGKKLIKQIFYKPALDRARGTQLELKITIPARSLVTMTWEFEKSILRFNEYPPDANRGFDVG